MRMAIRYLTTFTYDTQVSESQNALRAKPASDVRQRLIDYSVTVDPTARIFSYTDYWGTQVDCFGVIGRHTRLTVVADSSPPEPTTSTKASAIWLLWNMARQPTIPQTAKKVASGLPQEPRP